MPYRLRDAQGNILGEWDEKPTQDLIDSVLTRTGGKPLRVPDSPLMPPPDEAEPTTSTPEPAAPSYRVPIMDMWGDPKRVLDIASAAGGFLGGLTEAPFGIRAGAALSEEMLSRPGGAGGLTETQYGVKPSETAKGLGRDIWRGIQIRGEQIASDWNRLRKAVAPQLDVQSKPDRGLVPQSLEYAKPGTEAVGKTAGEIYGVAAYEAARKLGHDEAEAQRLAGLAAEIADGVGQGTAEGVVMLAAGLAQDPSAVAGFKPKELSRVLSLADRTLQASGAMTLGAGSLQSGAEAVKAAMDGNLSEASKLATNAVGFGYLASRAADVREPIAEPSRALTEGEIPPAVAGREAPAPPPTLEPPPVELPSPPIDLPPRAAGEADLTTLLPPEPPPSVVLDNDLVGSRRPQPPLPPRSPAEVLAGGERFVPPPPEGEISSLRAMIAPPEPKSPMDVLARGQELEGARAPEAPEVPAPPEAPPVEPPLDVMTPDRTAAVLDGLTERATQELGELQAGAIDFTSAGTRVFGTVKDGRVVGAVTLPPNGTIHIVSDGTPAGRRGAGTAVLKALRQAEAGKIPDFMIAEETLKEGGSDLLRRAQENPKLRKMIEKRRGVAPEDRAVEAAVAKAKAAGRTVTPEDRTWLREQSDNWALHEVFNAASPEHARAAFDVLPEPLRRRVLESPNMAARGLDDPLRKAFEDLLPEAPPPERTPLRTHPKVTEIQGQIAEIDRRIAELDRRQQQRPFEGPERRGEERRGAAPPTDAELAASIRAAETVDWSGTTPLEPPPAEVAPPPSLAERQRATFKFANKPSDLRAEDWTGLDRTPEAERAAELMELDARIRTQMGPGGSKGFRTTKKGEVRPQSYTKWEGTGRGLIAQELAQLPPEALRAAREVVDRARRREHIRGMVGDTVRLGTMGPRHKLLGLTPDDRFAILERHGQKLPDPVPIDEISPGPHFSPYTELAADRLTAVLDQFNEAGVKFEDFLASPEAGFVSPKLVGYLGAGAVGLAVAGPYLMAHPAAAVAAGLLAYIGSSVVTNRGRAVATAVDAFTRASVAGKFSVALLNAFNAQARLATTAASYSIGAIPGIAEGIGYVAGLRDNALHNFRADNAVKAAKAWEGTLRVDKNARTMLASMMLALKRDPVLWDRIGKLRPDWRQGIDDFVRQGAANDDAMASIMKASGVDKDFVDRFFHFTQGQLDADKIAQLGRVGAALTNSFLVFNAAVDRTTRQIYMQMALAPLMREYGVKTIVELQQKLIDPTTGQFRFDPLSKEGERITEAFDSATQAAFSYSGALRGVRTGPWKWTSKVVEAVNSMPLPAAHLVAPDIALFANYSIANVPEIAMQHIPLLNYFGPRAAESRRAPIVRAKGFEGLHVRRLAKAIVAEAVEGVRQARREAEELRRQKAKVPKGQRPLMEGLETREELENRAQALVTDAIDELKAAREQRKQLNAGTADAIREWNDLRKTGYYTKEQRWMEFAGAGAWVIGIAAAQRIMREDDGTSPTEIPLQAEPDENGVRKVGDVSRIFGPLVPAWVLGDMIGRKVLMVRNPEKYPNVNQFWRPDEIWKEMLKGFGYRQDVQGGGGLGALFGGSPEEMVRIMDRTVSDLLRMYGQQGAWMRDIAKGVQGTIGGFPEAYPSPAQHERAWEPVREGEGPLPVIGRMLDRVGETILNSLEFETLQGQASVPEAFDKILGAKRRISYHPASYFMTVREQSSLNRFLANIRKENLGEILPASTGVEWYDDIVNRTLADAYRTEGIFELVDDPTIAAPEKWQMLIDRMRDINMEAHTAAKRYADANGLVVPDVQGLLEKEDIEAMRRHDPFVRRKRIRQQLGLPSPGVRRRQMSERERRLYERRQRQLVEPPPEDGGLGVY